MVRFNQAPQTGPFPSHEWSEETRQVNGIWFALLWWKLRGFRVEDSDGMRAFTDFRRQLPMPNCAVYVLDAFPQGQWSMTADTRAMRAVAAV